MRWDGLRLKEGRRYRACSREEEEEEEEKEKEKEGEVSSPINPPCLRQHPDGQLVEEPRKGEKDSHGFPRRRRCPTLVP
jgi:hypothetical protein